MKKSFVFAILILFAICAYAQQNVSRYMFTTTIVDNEPVDTLFDYVAERGGNIYFFTELRNMQGTAHHLWYKNGELIYDFKMTVGAPRWRTNSSVKAAHFKPHDELTVEVTNESGNVLALGTLSIY
ncbi:MAG: DUF2914 domain-containing protein [Deferribacteraceae bacterium]|jgi:hypothetical protein|nr:DUF2914 domain-containing protein [Deferribacteraceae bacterium]